MKIQINKVTGGFLKKVKKIDVEIESKEDLTLEELEATLKELQIKRDVLAYNLDLDEVRAFPNVKRENYPPPKVKSWRKKWAFRRKPETKVRVLMMLNIGKWVDIYVQEKRKGFRFLGGTYIFDYRTKQFMENGEVFYFFHQDCPTSITWVMLIDKFKQMVKESAEKGNIPIMKAPMSLNPTNLDDSQGSEVITQIFESNKIQKWVKGILIGVVIVGIFAILTFILAVYTSGIFSEAG